MGLKIAIFEIIIAAVFFLFLATAYLLPIFGLNAVFSFTSKCIKEKRYIKMLSVYASVTAITAVIFVSVYNSDYVKQRKTIDRDWLYGKTLEQAANRYYCPGNDGWYMDEGWVLCAMSLYLDDWMDGIKFYDRYYARLDNDGKIIEIIHRVDN